MTISTMASPRSESSSLLRGSFSIGDLSVAALSVVTGATDCGLVLRRCLCLGLRRWVMRQIVAILRTDGFGETTATLTDVSTELSFYLGTCWVLTWILIGRRTGKLEWENDQIGHRICSDAWASKGR